MSQLQPYLLSLGLGLGIGVIYGLVAVRSPAPPIIALLGLLGMLAGEAGVKWLKGHANVVQGLLHEKSFAHRSAGGSAKKSDAAWPRSPPLPFRNRQETYPCPASSKF